jgi:hypothetical protein
LRRDRKDDAGWTTLVGEREGEPPAWPLDEPSERELVFWAREWRRPQAVIWERNGLVVEVAMYVRSLVVAERHDASVAARTLFRQQQEALGISIPGMLRNRWRITDQVSQAPSARPSSSSARQRFRVVSSDDVA